MLPCDADDGCLDMGDGRCYLLVLLKGGRRLACVGAVVLCCSRELMRAHSAGCNCCTHISMLARPLREHCISLLWHATKNSTEVHVVPFMPSLVRQCLLVVVRYMTVLEPSR